MLLAWLQSLGPSRDGKVFRVFVFSTVYLCGKGGKYGMNAVGSSAFRDLILSPRFLVFDRVWKQGSK